MSWWEWWCKLDELGRRTASSLHAHGEEVTSDSNKSCAVRDLHLLDASCTAAIYSTASSGSMDLCSLPLKTLNHGLYSWDSGRVSYKHQVMHIILLMSLSRRYSARGPWNCGVVHAKLDGLGHHAASIFKPLDKESRLAAVSPVRIAPCHATPY